MCIYIYNQTDRPIVFTYRPPFCTNDLEGGDDDFDYEASLCRCSLRVSGLFCCRVFCSRVRVRVTY